MVSLEGVPLPEERPMRLRYSTEFKADLSKSVMGSIASTGIVNVPLIAEEIRKRNEIENIALEDVELLVLETAQMFGAILEFDRDPTSAWAE